MIEAVRPTCCAQLRGCAEVVWCEANDYEFMWVDKRRGWGMIVDFDTPDTGGGATPERGRINFCPFCGSTL